MLMDLKMNQKKIKIMKQNIDKNVEGRIVMFLKEPEVIVDHFLIRKLIIWLLLEMKGRKSVAPQWISFQGLCLLKKVVFVPVPGLSKRLCTEYFRKLGFLSERFNGACIKTMIDVGGKNRRPISSLLFEDYITHKSAFRYVFGKDLKALHAYRKKNDDTSQKQKQNFESLEKSEEWKDLIRGKCLSEEQLKKYNFPGYGGDYPITNFLQIQSVIERDNANKNIARVFALDCEMCETCEGLELTRLSVVDDEFKVVYDEYVKPHNEIVDYRTEWSGVTENNLADVNTTLKDVQFALMEILGSNSIIAGHSLDNDLKALKVIHPNVLDTSLLFPHPNSAFRHKLKYLSVKYLGKAIQKKKTGHDSIEDAMAVLQLLIHHCTSLKVKNQSLNYLHFLSKTTPIRMVFLDSVNNCYPDLPAFKFICKGIDWNSQKNQHDIVYWDNEHDGIKSNNLNNITKACKMKSDFLWMEIFTLIEKKDDLESAVEILNTQLSCIYENVPSNTIMIITGFDEITNANANENGDHFSYITIK